MSDKELEEIKCEVQKLKARSAADQAFLRSAIFTLSAAQLRGAALTMQKLTEQMSVGLLFNEGVSDTANFEFDERKKFWLNALDAEIAARSAAGLQ
jgi:hypothetical protein